MQDGKTVLASDPFFWQISDNGDKMYKYVIILFGVLFTSVLLSESRLHRLKPFDAEDESVALTAVTDSVCAFA